MIKLSDKLERRWAFKQEQDNMLALECRICGKETTKKIKTWEVRPSCTKCRDIADFYSNRQKITPELQNWSIPIDKKVYTTTQIDATHSCGYTRKNTSVLGIKRNPECRACANSFEVYKQKHPSLKDWYSPVNFSTLGHKEATYPPVTLTHKCGFQYTKQLKEFLVNNQCPLCSQKLSEFKEVSIGYYKEKYPHLKEYDMMPLDDKPASQAEWEITHHKCKKTRVVSYITMLKQTKCQFCEKNLGYSSFDEWLDNNPNKKERFIDWDVEYIKAEDSILTHRCGFQIRKSLISHKGLCGYCDGTISNGEMMIYSILKTYNIPFKREFSFPGSKYRYDFYLTKQNLLIEYDGLQHFKDVSYYRSKKETANLNDKRKTELAEKNKIALLRIKYTADTLNKVYKILKPVLRLPEYKFNRFYYASDREENIYKATLKYRFSSLVDLGLNNVPLEQKVIKTYQEIWGITKKQHIKKLAKRAANNLFPRYEKPNISLKSITNIHAIQVELKKLYKNKYGSPKLYKKAITKST